MMIFGFHPYRVRHILVVGAGEIASRLISYFGSLGRDRCAVVGRILPGCKTLPSTFEGVPLIGGTDKLQDYLFRNAVDVVVFAQPLESIPNVMDLVSSALQLGIYVGIAPEFYLSPHEDIPPSKIEIGDLLGCPMTLLSTIPQRNGYLLAKRLLDIVVSVVGLLLFSPLLLMIALAVKLSSPDGPVLYPWRVLGTNRKPFVGYKFRTMVPDADRLKRDLMHLNEMEGPVFKIQKDPRITPIGRILRKYSLDELPQLYSVLKGDMSLVGPRPPSKEEADEYKFWQRRKLCVKPGITCLWQVNGRSEIKSFDEWAKLDLEYIERASFWLDLQILARTVPTVLFGRGAC